MSKGKEFIPCLYTNGQIMMKINIDPVVINFEELVLDTVSHFYNLDDALEFCTMSKKDIKKVLKSNAIWSNEDREPNMKNGYSNNEDHQNYNQSLILIALKLKQVFPQWENDDTNFERYFMLNDHLMN